MRTHPSLRPRSSAGVRGVNVAVLSDGREVHLDDIATAAEGQTVLDDIDAAILRIESQLEPGEAGGDPDWRSRAEAALKKKRRIRPALERRIGELRRAERISASAIVAQTSAVTIDAKRKAFVTAAYELLGHETCTEIWARAGERHPEAFPDGTRDGRP